MSKTEQITARQVREGDTLVIHGEDYTVERLERVFVGVGVIPPKDELHVAMDFGHSCSSTVGPDHPLERKVPAFQPEQRRVETSDGVFVVHRYNVALTPIVVYEAYERTQGLGAHTTTRTFDDGRYGKVTTRALPGDLAALAFGEARVAAVAHERQRLEQTALRAIYKAFDVRTKHGYRVDGGRVETRELEEPEVVEVGPAPAAATATDTARLEAELVVLDEFDEARYQAGHDYGNGQRKSELMRRRREVRRLGGREYPTRDDVDVDELNMATERLLRPRLKRVQREDFRRQTPSTTRTRQVLERMLADLERRLEAIRAAGRARVIGGSGPGVPPPPMTSRVREHVGALATGLRSAVEGNEALEYAERHGESDLAVLEDDRAVLREIGRAHV